MTNQNQLNQTTFPLSHLQVFSGSTLKILAMVAMLIDHIRAAILYYTATTEAEIEINHNMFNIGRIAFPIFCFLLVEGFLHTKDVKKYAIRLGIFSLISEVPFDLAFTREGQSIWGKQNVFWTLFVAVLVLYAFQYIEFRITVGTELQYILYALCAGAGCLITYYMKTDYSYKGILCILVLYLFRTNRIWQAIAGAISFYWQPWAMLAFIPILLYNGERGLKMKYVFYAFYPAHILILYCIAHFVMHLH